MTKGKDNLIPMNERTKDEQREIAQKGGIASGKARRHKRTMKEAAQIILKAPANAEQTELLRKYGIAEKDCTNLMVIMAKAVKMASDGNLSVILWAKIHSTRFMKSVLNTLLQIRKHHTALLMNGLLLFQKFQMTKFPQ